MAGAQNGQQGARSDRDRRHPEEIAAMDAIYVLLSVFLFALSWGLIELCDRL